MLKIIVTALALCSSVHAADTQVTCPKMETIFLTKKWHRVNKKGQVLENVKIVAPPGLKKSLVVTGENAVLRNVLVHHSASGMGIHIFKAKGVTFENVEV